MGDEDYNQYRDVDGYYRDNYSRFSDPGYRADDYPSEKEYPPEKVSSNEGDYPQERDYPRGGYPEDRDFSKGGNYPPPERYPDGYDSYEDYNSQDHIDQVPIKDLHIDSDRDLPLSRDFSHPEDLQYKQRFIHQDSEMTDDFEYGDYSDHEYSDNNRSRSERYPEDDHEFPTYEFHMVSKDVVERRRKAHDSDSIEHSDSIERPPDYSDQGSQASTLDRSPRYSQTSLSYDPDGPLQRGLGSKRSLGTVRYGQVMQDLQHMPGSL